MKKILFIILIILTGNLFNISLGQTVRAIHLGGNWGFNRNNLSNPATPYLPEDFFTWLHDINVEWVGLSVSLHVENSLDSTIELKYNNVSIPTFTDNVLNKTIQKLKSENFKVYITLAFEETQTSVFPVKRWQLGDPNMPNEDPNILPINWPWSLNHPNHEKFVKSFFKSYTSCAKHIAQICQQNEVEFYSIGTETERIFRTRSGGHWPNNFGNELRAMVDTVRKVYKGKLTYDMSFDALIANSFYGPGSNFLWEDLNLDVVGISAYFQLIDYPANSLLPDTLLDNKWQKIFDDYLIPLKEKNPGLPLIFLEFGYTNDINSPYIINSNEFNNRVFYDSNLNLIDDGDETQANIYRSFFKILNKNQCIVDGAFLWGNEISDMSQYNNDWNKMIHFGIRNKPVEKEVKQYYNLDTISISGSKSVCKGKTEIYNLFLSQNIIYDSCYIIPENVASITKQGNNLTIKWSDSFTGQAKIKLAYKNRCGILDLSSIYSINVTECTGLDKINSKNYDILVYPNPSTGLVNLELEDFSMNISIVLLNLSGQIVFQKTFPERSKCKQFFIGQKGLYFLRIIGNDYSIVRPIIVN